MTLPTTETIVEVCPCREGGCGVVSLKGLSVKTGHVPHCGDQRFGATAVCDSCKGRRSQRKGKRGQASMHKGLGGTGFTPSNEESARPYQLDVTVMPEAKKGDQIPASFVRFVSLDWTRRALNQARKAVPVGSGALPGVYMEPRGGGRWLLVEVGS